MYACIFVHRSNWICNYWNNCCRLKWWICNHDNLYVVLCLHESRNFCLLYHLVYVPELITFEIMQDYTRNILFFCFLFNPMSLNPRRSSSTSRFFWKTPFILVWMAGWPIFLSFNRTPYKRFFYILLSKNNQVINDWTKPRNNPSRAKLYKISFKIK